MSGGQGPDERYPTLAMARFAQHRGVPTDQILIEDQLKYLPKYAFSKRIATKTLTVLNSELPFSNNYHIFRPLF